MSEIPQAQHEEEQAPQSHSTEAQIGAAVNAEIPESDSRAEGGKSQPNWRAAKGRWVSGRDADGSLIVRGGAERPMANKQAIGVLKGATVFESLFRDDDGRIAVQQTLRAYLETAFGEEVFRFPMKNTTSASIAINSLKQLKKGDKVAITLRTHFNSRSIEITYPGFSVYPGGWGAEPVRIETENKGKGLSQEEAQKTLIADAIQLRKESDVWVPQEGSIKLAADAAALLGWDEDIEGRLPEYSACFKQAYKVDLDISDSHQLYKLTRMIANWKGAPGVLKQVSAPASGMDDDDPFADE